MLLGHAHPEVINAVTDAAQSGLSFGAPTELETEMAELLCDIVPSIELVRMVSSGTEATMSAIRLARGFTGRDNIVKFEGCYHGHSDSLLVKAGSGALTLGVPNSPGVPAAFAQHTLTLPFNNIDALEKLFADQGDSMLKLLSADGFHAQLDERCAQLTAGLTAAASKHGVPFCAAHAGGMFGAFFTSLDKVTSFDEVMACNIEHFKVFFHQMLEANVYLAPSDDAFMGEPLRLHSMGRAVLCTLPASNRY